MRGTALIFFLLCFSFLLYSFHLYNNPFSVSGNSQKTKLAVAGKLVWQKYNCQACHQLYGLGGYLGPDLTDLCDDTLLGFQKIRIMTQNGSVQMPKFFLSEEELKQLEYFLADMAGTGDGDPRSFNSQMNGMITEK